MCPNDSRCALPGTELGQDDVDERPDLLEQISRVLLCLSDVASGDLNARVSLDVSEATPIGAVGLAVNEMIVALDRVERDAQAIEHELVDRIATAQGQREAIQQLSSPVIQVRDRVLCVPVIGVMDMTRSEQLSSSLLEAVMAHRAHYAIIDVTGVPWMDTATIDHFLRLARSVGLLGARCAISGISATVALAIAELGVELSGVETYRSLKGALEHIRLSDNPRPAA
jgi:rsbT co-antagonist protein RsbR